MCIRDRNGMCSLQMSCSSRRYHSVTSGGDFGRLHAVYVWWNIFIYSYIFFYVIPLCLPQASSLFNFRHCTVFNPVSMVFMFIVWVCLSWSCKWLISVTSKVFETIPLPFKALPCHLPGIHRLPCECVVTMWPRWIQLYLLFGWVVRLFRRDVHCKWHIIPNVAC